MHELYMHLLGISQTSRGREGIVWMHVKNLAAEWLHIEQDLSNTQYIAKVALALIKHTLYVSTKCVSFNLLLLVKS